MTNIKVIVGSTRPGRFGIQPAEWILKLGQAHPEAKFELLDLQEVNLPLLDEAVPPLMQKYSQEHTKKWSKTIDETDAFIIVTPEYNHGMPAALKNAIDFLVFEWMNKPVAFVGYGADAGGTRSIEQLRQVAGQLNMYDISEQVTIANYWTQLDQDGKFQANDQQVANAEKMLAKIMFWSEKMKIAREELKK